MKVLFVCSGNKDGGVSVIVRNQGDSLLEKGINIGYFLIKGKGVLGYLKNVRKLRSLIRNQAFDILHAHYGDSGIVSYLAKRRDIPVVVSFMGSDLMGSIGGGGQYTFISRCFAYIHRFFARRYDCCIVKSTVQKDKLPAVRKFAVVPNGINLSRFYPYDKNVARRRIGLPVDKQLILFVSDPARLEKNYKLALESVSRIKAEEVKLIVVHGVTQNKVNDFLNACDVLLLTSFHEGSPNIIKEAMACNCPIVATDVGDVREIIGDIEGCYIAKWDPQDVSIKIRDALSFNKRTTGRCNITHLAADRIAERIIRIYEESV